MAIYVESSIRGRLDRLWELTQNPALHQQWDLRFTEIHYCSRQPNEPQRFRYRTRLGPGLQIEGWGESVGEHVSENSRVSSLRFGSDDPRSLIREGAGYWKYRDNGDALLFLTRYDYQPRWGVVGRIVDRWVFRPLIGWATAWSFDRLRLWIERGHQPGRVLRSSLIHLAARLGLSGLWLIDGLGLLFDSPVKGLGLIEVGLAFWVLAAWRTSLSLKASLAAAVVLFLGWAWPTTGLGPVSLATAGLLSGLGLITQSRLALARRCRRQPAEAH